MQRINILAVGTLKEKYLKDATAEYLKRLSRFASVEVKEVPEYAGTSRISVEQVKEVECGELEKKLSGYVVAMDKGGEMLSSEEFAKVISKIGVDGAKALTFVIGGSNGLTQKFLSKANKIISFGKITYPHQLMRVVLLEQLYRAETILNNVSYHK